MEPAVGPAHRLAPFASWSEHSRGRRFPEPDAPTRSDFQRDRDRIVHSTAFRRLVYKTQVFLNHEGDLFRTRLTHSLEVAQLARSIARALRLNEDLVEAIALAHDLGHTPFGHAGQDALNACMKALPLPTNFESAPPPARGFEHNLQSLRVVDTLEERYPAFDGLNLCFETREGILKHCSHAHAVAIEKRDASGVALRFVAGGSPSLEAQLCNLADAIAYNAHDIDDGVRSGLLNLEQLEQIPLFEQHRLEALNAHPHLNGRRLLFESIRLMLSAQVYDVLAATQHALEDARVGHVDQVRAAARPLVRFSPGMHAASQTLKAFLLRNLYRHPQVMETTERAKAVVTDLFDFYMNHPQGLEASCHQRDLARRVADHIAGMTDRFAIKEHQRLCGGGLFD